MLVGFFWGGLGPWGLEEAGPGEQGGTSTVLVVFAVIFVVGHCFTPLLFVIWISVKVPVLAIGTIYNIFHPIMYLSCMFPFWFASNIFSCRSSSPSSITLNQ